MCIYIYIYIHIYIYMWRARLFFCLRTERALVLAEKQAAPPAVPLGRCIICIQNTCISK